MKNGHLDDGLLQDLVEGLLDPQVEKGAREHLAACRKCRLEYETVSELMGGLTELPAEAKPERDLWPQIAWRIENRAGAGRDQPASLAEHTGISSREAVDARRSGARRFTFTGWQLLAASIAVALISGSAVWTFLARAPGTMPSSNPAVSSAATNAGWVDAFGGYDQALADLQTVVEQGRGVLDPETVRVLEENLATIDSAIQQAKDALERDPGSLVLQRLLSENLRRKVDLLRHAALAVYSNT